MARALLLLAAGLLAFPGLFVATKGISAIRRRSAVVQGKTITGGRAVGAGLVLVLWGAGMLGVAALILAAWGRR